MDKGQQYHKIRPIRISDEVWKELNKAKKRGLTWDRFFKKLIGKNKIVLQNPKEEKDQDKPKKQEIVIQSEEEKPVIVLQKPFNFQEKLKAMFVDKDRRFPIIAYYWLVKKILYANEDAYKSGIKRELRAAGELKGYDNEQIKKSVNWLKDNADFKWTLETVHKYIDEPLENLGKSGKPKTEAELLNDIEKRYAANPAQ